MLDPVFLEGLYRRYNRRQYVSPDPLEFLYRYDNPADREVVALIASSLAYGRVAQILKSVANALDRIGPGPARQIAAGNVGRLEARLSGFRHRFTSDRDVARLLAGMRSALRAHGSLKKCFLSGLRPDEPTVIPALERFAGSLGCAGTQLVPAPGGPGASKRLHLFLRWMVRRDDVDPGGWEEVGAHRLIVPMDTHMASIAAAWALTSVKSPGRKMAMEVTARFREIRPDDPVRFDFALTRFGIHPELRAGKADLCSTSRR